MESLNVFPKTNSEYLTGGFFLGMFSDDKNDYANYKLGNFENISEKRIQEMEVLSTLDGLGFPMQEVGTFLFKNMIIKAIHHLGGFDDFEKTISQDNLLQQMKSPFSQFYVDSARNDLGIGIKSFHAHIERILRKVDFSKANTDLLFGIYGDLSRKTDYGEHAFIIAQHMRAVKEKNASCQYCKTTLPVE